LKKRTKKLSVHWRGAEPPGTGANERKVFLLLFLQKKKILAFLPSPPRRATSSHAMLASAGPLRQGARPDRGRDLRMSATSCRTDAPSAARLFAPGG